MKKNGNKNTSDKGLEKMHNRFKMKMAWKEKGIKELDHPKRKKNAFGFPDKWQIRIIFPQISQPTFS